MENDSGSWNMMRGRLLETVSGKKGSYILEAVIAMPVFIAAVMVMCQIILMYACIEDCSFIMANEMRRGAAEAAYLNTSALIPHRIKNEVIDGHSLAKQAKVTDYAYRGSMDGQDELIALTLRLRLKAGNPIGLDSAADYDLALVTRAYIGKIRDEESMSEDEMSGHDADPVFIFPKRGEKYHSEGCGYLTAAAKSGTLTAAIRKKYKPCPLCGSRKAANGSRIYYFPSAGDDYHLPGCSVLERNYVEIDKKDAIERGYTPCSKCGG